MFELNVFYEISDIKFYFILDVSCKMYFYQCFCSYAIFVKCFDKYLTPKSVSHRCPYYRFDTAVYLQKLDQNLQH